MYKLEIETANHLRKFWNPQKARIMKILIFESIIQIMDDNEKWHYAGHTISFQDACFFVEEINEAIGSQKSSLSIDYIS